MKRHGGLFEKIIEYDNLEAAYKKASKGRKYQRDVASFHANLEENLITLQNELLWGSYKPGEYHTFMIYEPKERLIYAAPFRDRIVHHAIMNIIEPVWDVLFIHNSYACRKNKGTHAGVNKLQSMLASCRSTCGDTYVLKGDVRKFFPNINHHILMQIIERKIKCKRTLSLLRKIIFITGCEDDLTSHNLPIGNLISQWGANLYLNEFDMFIKHDLKLKYYVRYMDDFIILHPDKRYLHAMLCEIEAFLHSRLALNLNSKTSIFPANQGIDFLGFRIWENHRLLRKSSAQRMKRHLKCMRASHRDGSTTIHAIRVCIKSWLAHCSHCNSWRVQKRIMAGAIFTHAGSINHHKQHANPSHIRGV